MEHLAAAKEMNVFALRHPPVKSTAQHYRGRTLKRSLLNRIRTKTKMLLLLLWLLWLLLLLLLLLRRRNRGSLSCATITKVSRGPGGKTFFLTKSHKVQSTRLNCKNISRRIFILEINQNSRKLQNDQLILKLKRLTF